MKMRLVSTLMLVGGMFSAGASGVTEAFRTDMNPAFSYYQAFLLTPELDASDSQFLWETDWRGRKLPPRFGELIARYDNQIKLLRRAAHATVPCDWGIDMSPGPETLLPHLARAKAAVQTARLRALWELQNGDQTNACQDLVGAFALARNVAANGPLISTLMQIACEAIVQYVVAEHFYQFSPESLQVLLDGFDTAPPQTTVAASVARRKEFSGDWFRREIEQLRQENPGDDAKVMQGFHALFRSVVAGQDAENDLWLRVNKAAGGTSEGILRLLDDRDRVFERLAVVEALLYAQFAGAIKELTDQVQKSGNVLTIEGLPSMAQAREREFRVLTELAMVRAAVQYKLHGDAGLKSVMDPCGQGPFEFHRFTFEGVDRGFSLKSGLPYVLIFVEKEGPPFYSYGPKAGEPVQPAQTAAPGKAFKQRYGDRPGK